VTLYKGFLAAGDDAVNGQAEEGGHRVERNVVNVIMAGGKVALKNFVQPSGQAGEDKGERVGGTLVADRRPHRAGKKNADKPILNEVQLLFGRADAAGHERINAGDRDHCHESPDLAGARAEQAENTQPASEEQNRERGTQHAVGAEVRQGRAHHAERRVDQANVSDGDQPGGCSVLGGVAGRRGGKHGRFYIKIPPGGGRSSAGDYVGFVLTKRDSLDQALLASSRFVHKVIPNAHNWRVSPLSKYGSPRRIPSNFLRRHSDHRDGNGR